MATTKSVNDGIEGVSVLVVHDDPLEARFVAESLELADPAITARKETDSDAAIDAVVDWGVDYVVTDAQLGEVSGVDFLDRVARTDESVRAIVHTTEDDPEIATEAWKRGAAYAKKDPELERYDALARHMTGPQESR